VEAFSKEKQYVCTSLKKKKPYLLMLLILQTKNEKSVEASSNALPPSDISKF